MNIRVAKKAMTVGACAAAIILGGASAASAGEISGNGVRQHPVHQLPGNSLCAYSGLNDEFIEGDSTAPRTQNFGQIVRETGRAALGPGPGVECNPTRSTGE